MDLRFIFIFVIASIIKLYNCEEDDNADLIAKKIENGNVGIVEQNNSEIGDTEDESIQNDGFTLTEEEGFMRLHNMFSSTVNIATSHNPIRKFNVIGSTEAVNEATDKDEIPNIPHNMIKNNSNGNKNNHSNHNNNNHNNNNNDNEDNNNNNNNNNNNKIKSVSIAGDIILGGLFPVHEKGDKQNEPCGPKVYNRGVQRLEAMLYAIDRVNNDSTILKDIKIGVNILDTCSRDTYALNQSLQFIRSSLNNLDMQQFECQDATTPRLKYNMSGPVFGIIGGSYSSVSLQVANLLRLFHIPQISPASTAKALSDKTRFDLFARTVPPDTFQSIALVDFVKNVNWSYVSTIYSEGSYGEYGIEAFHKEASERNVCIAVAEKVPSTADDRAFDLIILKLLKKPNARGVILFTRAEDARRILQAAKRANLSQPLHWVASDGWGKQQKLVEGLEDVADGAITVELQSEYIIDFDDYMFSLTPANNIRNPWFEEYWQDTFGCLLRHNYPVELQPGENMIKVCDNSFRLSDKIAGYEQESKTQFVIDAVYAFAYALHNLHEDICLNNPKYENTKMANSICPEMANYDGSEFYKKYLLNVSFIDLGGSEVKFDKQGDGLARYDILNYQKLKNSSGYHYRIVGKWFNKLELNLPNVVWNKSPELPISACSLPCKYGMIKKQQGDTCCWICDNCEDHEFVFDDFTCKDCGPGRWPFPDKLSCYQLPTQYMRWKSLFAVIPMTMSLIGIVMTAVVIWLFIKNHDTPLVRASGRELSYMLLFGILLCYLNTFVLLAKPTVMTCIIQRFGIGVGFSIIYGALLTKTNRISRIFDSASKSAQRPNFISPRSQVIITISLIAIQILITMVWMIVEPPGTRFHYPNRKEVILKCNIQDMSFLFSQLYNMLLITICTVYAVKTRKIPENFNESKFIGFTMYTTCIIWLAFIPIYFGTGNSYEIQITTLSISIILSASVALICLYSPKMYILVFHPDKNVRKLTMNSAAYRKGTQQNLSIGAGGGYGAGGIGYASGGGVGVGLSTGSLGGGGGGGGILTSGGMGPSAYGSGLMSGGYGSGYGGGYGGGYGSGMGGYCGVSARSNAAGTAATIAAVIDVVADIGDTKFSPHTRIRSADRKRNDRIIPETIGFAGFEIVSGSPDNSENGNGGRGLIGSPSRTSLSGEDIEYNNSEDILVIHFDRTGKKPGGIDSPPDCFGASKVNGNSRKPSILKHNNENNDNVRNDNIDDNIVESIETMKKQNLLTPLDVEDDNLDEPEVVALL